MHVYRFRLCVVSCNKIGVWARSHTQQLYDQSQTFCLATIHFQVNNSTVRIGDTRQIGRNVFNVTITCNATNPVNCTEKVVLEQNVTLRETTHVCNDDVPFTPGRLGINGSFVSKFVCTTNSNGPLTTFMFLVNIGKSDNITLRYSKSNTTYSRTNCISETSKLHRWNSQSDMFIWLLNIWRFFQTRNPTFHQRICGK